MIKIGLIGCGFMGSMHANCYKNIEGVELVALADIREEKAKAPVAYSTLSLTDGSRSALRSEISATSQCLTMQANPNR